jgi:hypothetical protein
MFEAFLVPALHFIFASNAQPRDKPSGGEKILDKACPRSKLTKLVLVNNLTVKAFILIKYKALI